MFLFFHSLLEHIFFLDIPLIDFTPFVNIATPAVVLTVATGIARNISPTPVTVLFTSLKFALYLLLLFDLSCFFNLFDFAPIAPLCLAKSSYS